MVCQTMSPSLRTSVTVAKASGLKYGCPLPWPPLPLICSAGGKIAEGYIGASIAGAPSTELALPVTAELCRPLPQIQPTVTAKQFEDTLTRWLLFKPIGLIAPYLRTNYWLNGQTMTMKRPFSRPLSIRIDELDEIGVETTDQGPFAEDVFWILKRGKLRMRIGEPHPVFKMLLDRVGSLEAFDWQPFLKAMSCTDNAYFLCWRRDGRKV
jgi:hypothetical protein